MCSYTQYLEKAKFCRGQIVYNQGDPVDYIYLVLKGEFELCRKLPRSDAHIKKGYEKPHEQRPKTLTNILAQRMPEIKDFPYMYRLNILEVGGLAGEEDIFTRKSYSCTLKCYSHKGKVYKMAKEYFKMLK